VPVHLFFVVAALGDPGVRLAEFNIGDLLFLFIFVGIPLVKKLLSGGKNKQGAGMEARRTGREVRQQQSLAERLEALGISISEDSMVEDGAGAIRMQSTADEEDYEGSLGAAEAEPVSEAEATLEPVPFRPQPQTTAPLLQTHSFKALTGHLAEEVAEDFAGSLSSTSGSLSEWGDRGDLLRKSGPAASVRRSDRWGAAARRDWAKVVIMNEILGPPVSTRRPGAALGPPGLS